ncbi:MAG: M20/M25/M40 family metallo-hydrolase, partial [Oscillospiraceae bacterium]
MKILGFILLAIIAILLIAILVAVVRTILMKPKHKLGEALPVDEKRSDAYAKKLAEMLSKETISVAGEKDKSKFLQFHEILKNMYPNVHKTCEKTELNGNLIFKWKGKSAQKPILFMSHHDVVEANGEWKHPPFCGDVFNDEGEKVVWGRGAVDTKASLMCFMQAAEEMIGEGYVPENDVYLASSCTEELGGEGGPMLAKHLKDKGVHLAMLIDEGGMMMNEPIAGAKGTFAMIGVLEKGYGDVKFIAKGNGGHASAPPKNSPIARLAAFVNSVEKKNPFVSKFPNVVKEMFTRVAPTMPFMMKMIFGNLWLFGGLLKKLMPAISAPGAAMLRTTIAFTMQSGSAGYNVLPQEAYVTANLRYIPHQATDEAN